MATDTSSNISILDNARDVHLPANMTCQSNKFPVRTSDTLVCIPTYNEDSNICQIIEAILQLPLKVDIVVIDDNSFDRTRERVADYASREKRVALILRPRKLGVGSAHRLGWLYARQLGYNQIVTLDADLSHDPSDIPKLLEKISAEADVAIGSRFTEGGRLDYRGWRLFASKTANCLVRFLLRLPLNEYTTSLRAARLDRVPFGLVETIDHDGYSFFFVCIWRFLKAGLTVLEIPIHFHDRNAGGSKLSAIEILRAIITLAGLSCLPNRSYRSTAQCNVRHCPSCGGPYVVQNGSRKSLCLRCFYG
ncbi:MAG: glycosyltransferase [Deltaproteobacteria bacterium]|nr:glycosyltransferase [Deltaproteobacteria bacterium]